MNQDKKISVTLIEGDGIGPEITEAVLFVLDAAGVNIEWIPTTLGLKAVEQCGISCPDESVQLIRRTKVALKGPVTTPIGRDAGGVNFKSVNVELRRKLDLYANVRPTKTIPGVKSKFENVDLVFFRENTEGLYSGLEHEIVPGVVTSLKVATRKACTRIAEYAFSWAEERGRKKISAIHKANIMKLSDGLALECYREVAAQHPLIEYEERIIDATAMALVLYPEKFDCLLMENLYGDILSDLGAGLIGGLGLASSVNYGSEAVMFEAVHGSAPDIAGKGLANPSALLFSAIEMLHHVGQHKAAEAIDAALLKTLTAGKSVTADLGGKAKTMEFAKAVAVNL